MALTYSTEAEWALDAAARRRLLDAARTAIVDGLAGRAPLAPALDGHPPALCAAAATFVSLLGGGALRGCVGSLDAYRPLLVDAALNARAAAFEDPRFAPLTRADLPGLEIQVSVLSPPEPLAFVSEEALLRQLRPGTDGLILSEGRQRATFLPSVWASIGDAGAFLAALKHKAGLPADYWSDTIEVSRYTTVTVS